MSSEPLGREFYAENMFFFNIQVRLWLRGHGGFASGSWPFSCYGQDVSLDLTLLVIYLYEERNVWALPGNLSRAPGIPEFSV